MPLKIKDFNSKGQVAVLNKWADQIEANLGTAVSQQNFTSIIAQLTARVAVLEKKP